jgi:hypothetical protein
VADEQRLPHFFFSAPHFPLALLLVPETVDRQGDEK